MDITFFHCKDFEVPYLRHLAIHGFSMKFVAEPLNADTVHECRGSRIIAVHSQDDLSQDMLHSVYDCGVRFITTRSTGYNHIDLDTAEALGIRVAHVPAYSPESIAEYAVLLMLSLARKFPQSQERYSCGNYELSGLVGSTLSHKTIGIIGTGKIGKATIKILNGFGARVLAYDIDESDKGELVYEYVDLDYILQQSDIISLHIPLNEETKYFIQASRLELMKNHALLINTSRGGLINTLDLIDCLESDHIGAVGLDVYEFEEPIFFKNHSGDVIDDYIFNRLRKHPKVLISGHQAYLTDIALSNIASSTADNIIAFQKGMDNGNILTSLSANELDYTEV